MADGSSASTTTWHSAAELAGKPGVPGTERGVLKMAAREGWESRRKAHGKGCEYALHSLPATTQAALVYHASSVSAPPTESAKKARIDALWKRYESVPEHLKAMAKRRLSALQTVEQLVRVGQRLGDARAVVAAQLEREGIRGGSVASLGRWASDVAKLHRSDWLAALVPDYAGRTGTTEIQVEAWDLFKADYLRLEAPTASSCYARVQRIAKVKGWTLPCLRTFERRIATEIPRGVMVLRRQGEEALARTFPAQERDRTVFHALEAVNADGHKFDVFVRSPMGDIVRPIMVGVQDLYSGKLLGWRLAETESADLARMAFRDVVERFGIPSKVWLDNGRGFASKMLTGGVANRFRFKVREEDPTGVLVGLGMEIHWATPYHGQAKPIERAWRDLADTISKHPAFAGAYTGNKPDAKPENYGSKAVPWNDFVQVVNAEIAEHNARLKRRTRACGGVHSFDAAFANSYAQSTIRKATAEQLREMLLTAEVVTANSYNGSVNLSGNRYWCEGLGDHAGKKVLIRFDPDDLHTKVSVYTLSNVYLGDADCVAAVGFADTSAAREHSRARKDYVRGAKRQAKALVRMEVAALAAQIPQPAPENLPTAGVIAPVFGRPVRNAQPFEEPVRRTGTDDAPQVALGDLLKRMQHQKNEELGFEPSAD